MQKGTIVDLKRISGFTLFLRKNNFLIILFLFFVLGFCFGIFGFSKYSGFAEFCKASLEKFISSREGAGFLDIALDSFFSKMLFILICFVCGASMLGVVLIPASLAVKGFLYGGTTALLYSVYSLKGIAFHAVIILPVAIVFVLTLIFAAIDSMKFSLELARLTMSNKMPVNLCIYFKKYSAKFLMFTFFVLVSAVIDAMLCVNLLEKFIL